MFVMDVPYIPEMDTPVLMVQAGPPAPPADYIFNACKETFEDPNPRSAIYAVDPAYMLRNYLVNVDQHQGVRPEDIKVKLLQGTQHGDLLSSVSNYGRTTFHYDLTSGFIGDDRAIFMAEYQGKYYKIILDIKVLYGVDEYNSECPDPVLHKAPESNPDENSTTYRLNLDGVTFANLDNGALGQSNALGITLDDNANGYGWYVDRKSVV